MLRQPDPGNSLMPRSLGSFPIGKKTGKELETGNLIERLITCYPLVGDDRRVIYVLQKVEGKHLCHLLTLYLFHP